MADALARQDAAAGRAQPRGLRAFRDDVRAALERDPAARGALEIALCYPGVHAIWGYRVTHWLWVRQLRLTARVLSEVVRVLTGVDIHPGAALGPGLFIDHATGVVIGETAEVGADVTLYHAVTLGATSAARGKRHPTIGDRVVIGAGAKILGPVTVGADASIGANAVVVKPVPPGAVVVGVPGQVIGRSRSQTGAGAGAGEAPQPDLVGTSLESLLIRVARLEAQASRSPQADGRQRETPIRPPQAGVWYGEDFSI